MSTHMAIPLLVKEQRFQEEREGWGPGTVSLTMAVVFRADMGLDGWWAGCQPEREAESWWSRIWDRESVQAPDTHSLECWEEAVGVYASASTGHSELPTTRKRPCAGLGPVSAEVAGAERGRGETPPVLILCAPLN